LIRFFAPLFCLSLLIACEPKNVQLKTEIYTLGTLVQIDLSGKKKNNRAFIENFKQTSEQQTLDLYAWGNGELVQLNSALKQAKCTTFAVSDDMLALLRKSVQLNELSQGLFSPNIKPLVELWGFHRIEEMRSIPPSDEDIQIILKNSGTMQDLNLSSGYICTERALELDLGAIAKGWAAQTILQQLTTANIDNALINIGGDLIAKGQKDGRQAWRVGLKNPNINDENLDTPAVFTIADSEVTAIFTSGDYERQFEHQGNRAHHILDPRTGYPNIDIRSVTVIHSDPVLADAAATALHVAGLDWQANAKRMNLEKVLVLLPNKRAQITPQMAKITTWLDPSYQIEVIQ